MQSQEEAEIIYLSLKRRGRLLENHGAMINDVNQTFVSILSFGGATNLFQLLFVL